MTDVTYNWVKSWPDAVIEFCERYDKSSSKPRLISVFSTGGGMSLSDIAEVPGASKRFAMTFQPYSMEDTIDFVKTVTINADIDTWNFCSAEASQYYHTALIGMCAKRDYLYVAVTAALTTTRWRRGDNRAFVTLSTKDGKVETWKISLNKHSKDAYEAHFLEDDESVNIDNLTAQRRIEDNKVSRAVMAIILNDRSFASLSDEEYITKHGRDKHWLDGED